MFKNLSVSRKRLLLFCLLAFISIHGIVHLPIHPDFEFKGLDFQNMWSYSVNCYEWPIPYHRSGVACGDVLNRSMLYPPVLVYILSSWPRLFTFHHASYIWEGAILFMVTFGSILLWSLERRKKLATLAAFGLLYLQLPMFYALERGNNDAIVVLMWCAGAYLYVKHRHYFWAGILFGAAAADKIYPAFGLIGMFVALAFARDWKTLYLLIAGSALAFLGLFVLLWPSSWIYFFEIAPMYSRDHSIAAYFGHSLFRGPPSMFIKFPLLFMLGYGFSKRIKDDPLPALAFFCTFGTFLPNVANDYSLITAMPFALVMLHRALRERTTTGEWVYFVVLMYSFFGDRTPFALIRFSKGHQLLFIVMFLGLAYIFARTGYFWKDEDRSPAWEPEGA